jgi:hypothetical protein
MSRKLNVDSIKTSLARIRPYILVNRVASYNNNYWQVSDGQAGDLDGTPNGSGIYWLVTVTSPTGIPAAAGWFNAKERVYITGQTDGGTRTDTAWEVMDSTVDGNSVDLVLKSQNANSFADAESLEEPVTGLLVRGTANVSDFESFCARPPGLITSNEDEFWIETTRDAQCIDELYEEWRSLVMDNNPLYRNYYDLDPVAYNKQSGEDFQRRFVNSVFFNKALANQTLANVNSLADINSVEPGGARCVGKRANAIGIFEQHLQKQRVRDLQGAQLNLPALFKALYRLQRLRESIGVQSEVIEMAIPSQFYPAFNQAMLQYRKTQMGNEHTFFTNTSPEMKKAPMGFAYTDYPLMWPKVTLRLVFDRYFDDYLAANTAVGQEDVGRMAWIIDWSKIYVGILASERVVNKTGDLKTLAATDPSYQCVMRVPTSSVTMTSFTWTLICEAPDANLVIHNFSGETPEVAEDIGDYDQTCDSTDFLVGTTTTTSTSTSTTTAE